METEDLPSIDPNIDYRKILPIHQKRTIAFINHFIMTTVSFLNDFAQSCESRLMDFEYKIQKVEASLMILESQLSSIPDLDDVTLSPTNKSDNITISNTIPSSESSPETSPIKIGEQDPVVDTTDVSMTVERQLGPKASEDPRFIKFFKMVQFGVPPTAVKLKMQSEGIDPDILDKPNETIPGYVEVLSNSSDSSDDSD